jgi:hypothetical protein
MSQTATPIAHYFVSSKEEVDYVNPTLNTTMSTIKWKIYIDKELKTQVGTAISYITSLKTGKDTATNFMTMALTHRGKGVATTNTAILQKNKKYLPFSGKIFGAEPKNVDLNAYYTANQISYNNGQRIIKAMLTTITPPM